MLTISGLFAVSGAAFADARPRDVLDAAQIELALQKLQVTGSALYIAAHPDDENTAFLTWLSREKKVRAAYLSLTRGDGGQNLIGEDLGELLGVIRTQELMAARRVDGAEQFFTRALDFGFSKGPDETLAIWGKDSILADVVWVIRRFRPDIVVTRFPMDASGGHGHHTASAILADEAFRAAADPARFPEQLKWVKPWQAKRIFWNAFVPDPNEQPNAAWLKVDVGAYNRLLGRSYSEIAGESRSNHKSQGFGAPERRGTLVNYFAPRAGEPAQTDLFDGVDLGWSRFAGGAAIAALLRDAEKSFDPQQPAATVPVLLKVHAAMAKLPDEPIVRKKRAELLEVIRSCTGLWIEAIARTPTASPGGRVTVTASALNRASFPLTIERIELPGGAVVKARPAKADGTPDTLPPVELRDRALPLNRAVAGEATIALTDDQATTQPYWLRARATKGRFVLDDPSLTGEPENAPALLARFVVRAGTERLTFEVPVVYRWTDPVAGERYRPFEVAPPVTLRFDQGVYVFGDSAAKEIRVTATSGAAAIAGRVRLELPTGWRSSPESMELTLGANGQESTARFRVTPGDTPAAGTVTAVVEANGHRYAQRLVRLDYPHIPIQTLFPPAEAHLVRVDLKRSGDEVGYVMGSGDAGPDALRQCGYRVTLLSDDDVESASLARFDAVVVGVRAYNTRPRLRALQPRLLDYARAGGTLVLQYNTADEGLTQRLGPDSLHISRDRVTVEEAEVRFLRAGHPLLTTPNRITAADFDGWVQERGLYYPDRWGSSLEPVISCNDPGEPPRDGAILFAPTGKGVFVYTGLSFFRELPAGVPGAYRLFVNLVSGGRAK